MNNRPKRARKYYRSSFIVVLGTLLFCLTSQIIGHPLGNFTINHFARIEITTGQINIKYVIDMAEIPTLQELQSISTGDERPSSAKLDAYLDRLTPSYVGNLILSIDGAETPLSLVSKGISLPPGAGGLSTMRIEYSLHASLPNYQTAAQRLHFEDRNHNDRIGWRETVIAPGAGVNVFNTSAYGDGLTDELKSYPTDMLSAPLNERTADCSFTLGPIPQGATLLRKRDGRPVEQTRDRLAELIQVDKITPGIFLFALLAAVVLGAGHALSPGHGKTVVGAYLIGSRGTAGHAAFLGLTVTITHTLSVFVLGLVTLFASHYILPERLYPVLSVISGGFVLILGLMLFIQRSKALLARRRQDGHSHSEAHDHHHHAHDQNDHHHSAAGHTHDHNHGHNHDHDHSHNHDHVHPHTHDHSHDTHTHESHDHHHHDHEHSDPAHVHSHGGRAHSHLPPGADNTPVTWKSLLGIGISGGLLPCPSALVVMLSAITFKHVGFGLILVTAFSIGLAGSLTAIGLIFVYAGKFLKGRERDNRLVRIMPIFSAGVITCLGAFICYEALIQAGYALPHVPLIEPLLR